MKKLIGIIGLFLAAIVAGNALAQPAEPYERRRFSQMELDRMLAPIALYPDALLSQILMAATYPRDVFEAAGWTRANRISGQEAVRAVEREPWDPSVISLAAFPHVLEMMDERREWTERLGEAFLAQPEQVMDTVQELRRRAYEAGHLRSTNELYVERSGDEFVIESPPEVVYVPYYDPRVVYGRWWWPGYDPVWWSPWSGYSYAPGWGFGFGPSVFVGSTFFFGGFDWRHRYVRYSHNRPWYWRGSDFRHGHRWSHDRNHRWRDGDRRDWRDARDGRGRDGRDGRWRDRDGRGQALQGPARLQNGAVSAPPPQASPRSQAVDRYQARERAYREQPLSGAATVAPGSVQGAAPAPAPVQRSYDAGRLSAPRSVHVPSGVSPVAPAPQPRGERVAPVQRVAPVERAPQPVQRAPQGMERPAVAPAPHVERAAPAPRAERPAPAPRAERAERPERSGGDLSGPARFRDR